jgi:hypothetical protein
LVRAAVLRWTVWSAAFGVGTVSGVCVRANVLWTAVANWTASPITITCTYIVKPRMLSSENRRKRHILPNSNASTLGTTTQNEAKEAVRHRDPPSLWGIIGWCARVDGDAGRHYA